MGGVDNNSLLQIAPTLARGHVAGEAGRLRVARHAIAPAPDRFANAVSRLPSPAAQGRGYSKPRNAGLDDDLAEFLDVAFDDGAEFLRRVADRLQAECA